MPRRNQLVPEGTAVFKYISTQTWTLGVPTSTQSLKDKKILIEINTVIRDYKTEELRYTGLVSWIGISQIVVIEEFGVKVSRDA